jgi:hypothetical protein
MGRPAAWSHLGRHRGQTGLAGGGGIDRAGEREEMAALVRLE